MSKGQSFELDAWVCGTYDDDEVQTKIVLRYEPSMPWSVKLATRTGVIRHIDRDMLREGLYVEQGSEEVLIRPDSNGTMTEIRVVAAGVNGPHLFIRVPNIQLVRALDDMQIMVSRGHEAAFMDWTAGVAHCEADAA